MKVPRGTSRGKRSPVLTQPSLTFPMVHTVCGTELVARWVKVFADSEMKKRVFSCPTCGVDDLETKEIG